MGRETLCTLQTGPLCISYIYARFCMVIPRTGQTAWGVGLTQEVPPLGIQVGLVGKAAFEHISAIVGAGPGTRDSPAMSTVDQLHDGPRTFWGQRYLVKKGSLSSPLQSLCTWSPASPEGALM